MKLLNHCHYHLRWYSTVDFQWKKLIYWESNLLLVRILAAVFLFFLTLMKKAINSSRSPISTISTATFHVIQFLVRCPRAVTPKMGCPWPGHAYRFSFLSYCLLWSDVGLPQQDSHTVWCHWGGISSHFWHTGLAQGGRVWSVRENPFKTLSWLGIEA